MHLAACQAPDEPGVDSPETKFPGCGTLACFGHVVQNPFDFRCAEIGIDDEARALADEVCLAFRLQAVAVFRSAPVLPDDGVVDGLFGINVPHDGVSRWLVMPMPAMLSPLTSIFVMASAMTEAWEAQISLGLCSPSPNGENTVEFTLRDGADFSL